MQIKVVERTQEILVQEQEMVRKEAELEATVSSFIYQVILNSKLNNKQ